MSVDPQLIDDLKRKLRSLKKLEIRIRGGNTCSFAGKPQNKPLVWDEFFDINGSGSSRARYTLKDLAAAGREEYKNIVAEYFFSVYYKFYMENGIVNLNFYDPEILRWMGLPPDAGFEDIKKRFRELAKKYHPDTGGDGSKFIELMDNYKKLTE